MKYLMLFLLLLSFSCSKKDPTPELRDEIYKDLSSEFDIMTKSLETAEKDLEQQRKEIDSATPQTGQRKSFEAKYFEAKNALDRLKQQKQFFEIKVAQRKELVKVRYEESLTRGGRKWPDPEETELYKAKLKLYRDKIAWDKNKGMVKKVPRGTEKKEAAPVPPSGGH